MWTASYSKVIKSVKKEAIWQRWSDVSTWQEWMPNIESCKLDKTFVTGSRITLKPKGSSAVTVELVEVKKDQRFIGCTRFFGATMYDIHEMHQDPQGIRLTVTLKVTGPLGFFWRKLVGEKIEANLPKLVNNLASLASAPALKKDLVLPKPSILGTKKPNLQLVTSVPQSAKPRQAAAVPKKAKLKSSVSTLKKLELSKPMSEKSTAKTTTTAKKDAPKKKAAPKPKAKTAAAKSPKTVAKKAKPAAKAKTKTLAAKKPKTVAKKAKPATKTKTKAVASKKPAVKKSKPTVKKKTVAKKAKTAVTAKKAAPKAKPKAKAAK